MGTCTVACACCNRAAFPDVADSPTWLQRSMALLQGSSPAAHDKGDDEGFSSEDEADRPTPPAKRSTIANFRPLYSIYVPHSDRQAHVMPIPTASRDDLHRSSSVPADVEAAVGEGGILSFLLGIDTCIPRLKGALCQAFLSADSK